MTSKFRISQKKGFTLVELLVVISIIAVLLAVLLPSLSKARNQAKLTVCRSNLSQLGKVWIMYAGDNRDYYPTGAIGNDWGVLNSAAARDAVDKYCVGSGNKLFYCPNYTFTDMDGDGKIENWEEPTIVSGINYYEIGYWIFTNIPAARLDTSDFQPGKNADGISTSWTSLAYRDDLKDDGAETMGPAVKTLTKQLSYRSNNRSTAKTISIIPSDNPILWDITLKSNGKVSKKYVMHIQSLKDNTAGRNAVMMDGHTEWERITKTVRYLNEKGTKYEYCY